MDSTEVAAPVIAPPARARLPAFHRGMRTIILLNALGPLLVFPLGYAGLAIWFLMFCASVLVLIWTLYAVLRRDHRKLAPGIALALVIYFCARALYTDLNPFVPYVATSGPYEGSPAAWTALDMISILFVVWAFHIWNDFTGIFSRIRAALALFVAVALFFMTQLGRAADEDRRGYDPSPSAHTSGPDPSFAMQKRRQTRDTWGGFAIIGLIVISVISSRPRWRPREVKAAV
jgi:hypothetical protein